MSMSQVKSSSLSTPLKNSLKNYICHSNPLSIERMSKTKASSSWKSIGGVNIDVGSMRLSDPGVEGGDGNSPMLICNNRIYFPREISTVL